MRDGNFSLPPGGDFEVPFKVFSLPMRDGNLLGDVANITNTRVFSLPMRDGNLLKLAYKLAKPYPVFSLPMRDGNGSDQ